MTIRTSSTPGRNTSPWLLDRETSTRLRPGYEGANISCWIGFKHICYLVEAAVLEHFRVAGFSTRSLCRDHHLCLEVVDLDTRISTAFHTDDVVEASVTPAATGAGELVFRVSLSVRRDTGWTKAARSLVRVLLRRDRPDGGAEQVPDELRAAIVDRVARTVPDQAPVPSVSGRSVAGHNGRDPVLAELTRGTNAFAWGWRIPYFYCHFTERLQLSGYLRQLEEAVDLFLADRGVSIKRLLDEQGWIPVVPHSAVAVLAEVVMEEYLYTVLTVESIFKNLTYTARMDAYLLRDGELRHTATGRITHGYAQIDSHGDLHLVELDRRMLTALAGG